MYRMSPNTFLLISQILPDGVAAKDGRLKEGDIIVRVSKHCLPVCVVYLPFESTQKVNSKQVAGLCLPGLHICGRTHHFSVNLVVNTNRNIFLKECAYTNSMLMHSL